MEGGSSHSTKGENRRRGAMSAFCTSALTAAGAVKLVQQRSTLVLLH